MIFGNPTNGILMIEGAKVDSQYKLVSSRGVVLKKGVISSDYYAVDLNGLSNGFYFIIIDDVQKKIIKQ